MALGFNHEKMLPQTESPPTEDYKIRRKRVALKSLKIFWIVICLSGLVYQTILVSEQYFSYLTSSTVTVSNGPQKNETIPAITVCLNVWDILNIQLLKKDNICSNNASIGACKKTYFNIKINQVLKYQDKEFVLKYSSKTYSNTISSVGYRLNMNVTEFMTEYFKCFTFTSSVEKTNRDRIVFEFSLRDLFQYHTEHTSYFYLYINRKRARVEEMGDLNQIAMLPRNSSNVLTYTLFKTIKTSTPIRPCMDYSDNPNFETRSSCIRQCQLIKEIQCCQLSCKENYNKTQFNCSYENVDRFLSRGFSFRPYYSKVPKPRMFPGIDDCNDCPQDCVSFMHLISTHQNKIQIAADFYLKIHDTDPVVEIDISVKISLIEYIIYIASCIGLWFGFSLFQMLSDLTSKLKKSLDEKNNNSNPLFIKTNRIQTNSENNITMNSREDIHGAPLFYYIEKEWERSARFRDCFKIVLIIRFLNLPKSIKSVPLST